MGKLSSVKPKIKNISTIRTSSPAVDRLTGSTGVRVRGRVLKRDGYLCQECLAVGWVTVADEVDHVMPLHLGGSNADNNQISICRECHRVKSEREEKKRQG